eukprot:575480-Pelagomonas_calceolata.AAC.1
MYMAGNASNLLLTRGTVQEAMRGKALASRYPEEIHLRWQDELNGGRWGFHLVPSDMEGLDATTIQH